MNRVLLSFEERVQIETLISQRVPLTSIAKKLNRHRSTITREIRRTTEGTSVREYPIGILKSMYRATAAQMQANKRARHAGRPSSLNQYSQKVLIKEIRNNHLTPAQVIAKHPKLFSNTTVIYNWINHNKIKGLSNEDLPMNGKRFKRGSNKRFLKFTRKNAVGSGIAQHYSINKRPQSVNNRRSFGHWELDGVESPQNASHSIILTLIERKSRYLVAIKSKSKKGVDVAAALGQFSDKYGDYVKSITCDNGPEFVNGLVFTFITRRLGDLYVAHPYAPYERGTNERANRNLRARWYFPKKTDFKRVSQERLDQVTNEINHKPLTTLLDGHQTPDKLFKKYCKSLKRRLNR